MMRTRQTNKLYREEQEHLSVTWHVDVDDLLEDLSVTWDVDVDDLLELTDCMMTQKHVTSQLCHYSQQLLFIS